MKVNAVKLTDDWLVRKCCGVTINEVSIVHLADMYKCEHSPIRTQMFLVDMTDIPTFVSVHFVRHKVGVEHFVLSKRDDRKLSFIKPATSTAPWYYKVAGYLGLVTRWTAVNHVMFLNAQSLIHIARKRLCNKAHKEVVKTMVEVKDSIGTVDPFLFKYLVPECRYRNKCNEIRPCKKQEVT